MIAAIALAIERDGTKRNQDVIDDQHDIGPLMTDDEPVAMIERLSVFRMQTRTMLQGTIDDDGISTSSRIGICVGRKTGRLLRANVSSSRPSRTRGNSCRRAPDADGPR